ncbi:MAG: hypothetical protein KJ787_01435 [Gammaproteobacteria bacterium]|nr:hypothetical protein [Gammaproteobacteria bacterium]MBU1644980.1 hypothetical protein [Gammaproteobacteria bacterium]MBU1971439.1 hypothetical protein [Gammaproteobacteria bacterium]
MNNVPQTPGESRLQSTAIDESQLGLMVAEQSMVAPEQLMPYGEAAKAIFIKANGVTAYNRGIRFVRRAD